MSAPNRLAELKAFWHEYNGSKPVLGEDRVRFVQQAVRSLAATDPRFGHKARAGGIAPVSAGTIGYWLGALPLPTTPADGQIDAIDITTSGGQVYWGITPAADYQNIYARWYPVVSTPQPEPVPHPIPDPPQPKPEPPACQAKYAALTELVNELMKEADQLKQDVEASNRRLKAIEDRLAEGFKVQTNRVWGHAHEVQVKL